MNIFERLAFRLKTGADIVDLGQCEEVVIKYEDYYISLLINEDGIGSLSWSKDPTMFNVPLRDIKHVNHPQGE